MLSWRDWCRRLRFFRPRRRRCLLDGSSDEVETFVLLREGDPLPAPGRAGRDGLLAVGGSLTVARLLEAYRQGIFPWYEPGVPVLWWSPDPRLVLDPAGLRVARSLRALIRKRVYSTTFDTAFQDVIRGCATTPRKDGQGTWITPEVEAGYTALHDLGYAHSVETWRDGALAGGLYGVFLGRCFFGESMFSRRADASKVALVALARELIRREVALIDSQWPSDHLIGLGATLIPRAEFLRRLREALAFPDDRSRWTGP